MRPHEDRLKNMAVASNPQLTNRSQIRVAQLSLDYTGIDTGMTRRASLNVAKAMNILGASKPAETNITGLALTNPVSLTFLRTGASFSQTNEWPWKIGSVVSTTGQFSPDTLPTSEQIAFGAQRFALGYQPGTPRASTCVAARRIRAGCRRWARGFACRMRSTTASICRWRAPSAMRRSKARHAVRA